MTRFDANGLDDFYASWAEGLIHGGVVPNGNRAVLRNPDGPDDSPAHLIMMDILQNTKYKYGL